MVICYVCLITKIKLKNIKWGYYHPEILTFPFFSLGKPSQSLTSCPNWLQRPQGLGLFGLNSSMIMVKLGSCVARPSIMRSAISQQQQNTKQWAFPEDPYCNQTAGLQNKITSCPCIFLNKRDYKTSVYRYYWTIRGDAISTWKGKEIQSDTFPQRKAPSQPHRSLLAKTKTNTQKRKTTSQTRGLTTWARWNHIFVCSEKVSLTANLASSPKAHTLEKSLGRSRSFGQFLPKKIKHTACVVKNQH